jgi:hypothetical protein
VLQILRLFVTDVQRKGEYMSYVSDLRFSGILPSKTHVKVFVF